MPTLIITATDTLKKLHCVISLCGSLLFIFEITKTLFKITNLFFQ